MEGGAAKFAELIVDPDSCVDGHLRPGNEDAKTESFLEGVEVRRWAGDLKKNVQPRGMVEAFNEVVNSWPAGGSPRLKVKNFDVQLQEGGREVVTRTDYHAYVEGDAFSVQQQGKWQCRWRRSMSDEDLPLLISIRLIELEEVRSNHEGRGAALVDVTMPLLGEVPAFQETLKYGANHWITRLPRLKHRFQHGLSIGDVNGDGHEDVYICQPEGLPNILLVRNGDGSVKDAASEFGLDFRDNTTSVIFADFDNDGDQDLAAAFRSPFGVFENVNGRFERRFSLPHLGQVFNLAVADVDADGLLDIFICRYQNLDERGVAPSAIPLHDAQNGGANTLLRNVGDWGFRDVTSEVGLNHNNNRWTVAASWEDYDRDGDLDLYVANDYGRNNLYRCETSEEGKVFFRDIAAETGVEDMTTSMGVIWGDPNRDGVPDVYVSNMYSSAGRRVTFQKGFKSAVAGSDNDHVKAWQHAAMGNSLFQGHSDGSFSHISKEARVYKGLWSWGTTYADINHDGWDDLLVVNGFITGPGKAPDL